MSLWREKIVPGLIHAAMRSRRLQPLRRELVAQARGVVLEIGIGSGLNLPHYGRQVRRLIGIDPCLRLLERARRDAVWMPFEVRLLPESAERLPLPEASVDTVVSSWSLCSIPDIAAALAEIRRVLRPGGRFLFLEHGLSDDARVARWQRRLTPLWCRVSGGCHLDRPIAALLEQAGLRPLALETGYLLPGPRILTYHYRGAAVAGVQASAPAGEFSLARAPQRRA